MSYTWMRLQDANGVLADPEDDVIDRARIAFQTDYHWTPECQRAFLEALATTGSVTRAAKEVNKSPRAAYGLRFRRHGFAFRVAWDASLLVARDVLADMLMDRAVNGFEETRFKDEYGAIVRGRFDNGLSSRILGRLDSMIAKQSPAADYMAKVHLAVSDYEAFLDLIESGGTGDAAEAFFAQQQTACDSVKLASDIHAAECELVRNTAVHAVIENAEQAVKDDPDIAAAQLSVWFDNMTVKWITNFPPPPAVPNADGNMIGQIVQQWGAFGAADYRRTLTKGETLAHEARLAGIGKGTGAPMLAAANAARDAWFAPVAAVGTGA